jgi:hypothetical protein
MMETIMSIHSVQSFLTNAFHTDKIKVREDDLGFTIEPLEEERNSDSLLGSAIGSKLTVEKFLEMTREDNASW